MSNVKVIAVDIDAGPNEATVHVDIGHGGTLSYLFYRHKGGTMLMLAKMGKHRTPLRDGIAAARRVALAVMDAKMDRLNAWRASHGLKPIAREM